MTAEIIPFPVPSLIEHVARRMVPAMEAPLGEQRDEAKDQVFLELSAGYDNGFPLNHKQWAAVWRRVDELMHTKETASG